MKYTFDYKKIAIGDYIRQHRKLAGLSQEKLACLLGTSTRSLSNVENGYAYPSFKLVYKLNNLLKINLIEYFSSVDNDPLFVFISLYEQYLHYLETREYDKLHKLFEKIDFQRIDIAKDTIYYKQLLFVEGIKYLINKDNEKCYESLSKAYNLKLPKPKRSKDLDYRILLLIESIAPTLEKNSGEIAEISIISINKLENTLNELKDYPYLKMRYLYNILTIKVENINDYDVRDIFPEILALSLNFNCLDIYYQSIFYRGLFKKYKNDQYFYNDIDDSLIYFYISSRDDLFEHNIRLLHDISLI